MRTCALILVLAGATALAGCGKSGVDARNESPEAVASKVAASGVMPRPGRWQSSMTVEKMEMPGMPPQASAAMNKALGTATVNVSCLTPEQANRPSAEFFQKAATGCTYDHFTMADGKIDAAMACTKVGRNMHMVMNGTFDPDHYNVRVTNQSEMQPGKMMNMTMAITSQRLGDCDGTEGK